MIVTETTAATSTMMDIEKVDFLLLKLYCTMGCTKFTKIIDKAKRRHQTIHHVIVSCNLFLRWIAGDLFQPMKKKEGKTVVN